MTGTSAPLRESAAAPAVETQHGLPAHYTLSVTLTHCATCDAQTLTSEIWGFYVYPGHNSGGYSRPIEDRTYGHGRVFDVPIKRHDRSTHIPFCHLCVDRIVKEPLPFRDNKRKLHTAQRDAARTSPLSIESGDFS